MFVFVCCLYCLHVDVVLRVMLCCLLSAFYWAAQPVSAAFLFSVMCLRAVCCGCCCVVVVVCIACCTSLVILMFFVLGCAAAFCCVGVLLAALFFNVMCLFVVVCFLSWIFCSVDSAVVVLVGSLLVRVVPHGLMAVVYVFGVALIVHCWLVLLCVTACCRSVVAIVNCRCFSCCLAPVVLQHQTTNKKPTHVMRNP